MLSKLNKELDGKITLLSEDLMGMTLMAIGKFDKELADGKMPMKTKKYIADNIIDALDGADQEEVEYTVRQVMIDWYDGNFDDEEDEEE